MAKTITITLKSGNMKTIFAAIDKQFSCEGKVKYGHEATAKKACRAMREKGEWGLVEYRCRHCPDWHIGHA